MKKQTKILALTLSFLLSAGFLPQANLFAQDKNTVTFTSADANAKSNADIEAKAAEWVNALNLNNASKEEKVKTAIAAHLKAVRDFHNAHPFTEVPAGINPATGNRLSDMDRTIISHSAKPASIHENLMDVLKAELTPEQVEFILDKYTIGKVDFTLKGYKAIVPDLKPEEEAQILTYLKQAREQAIDFKNMKEISAIFEIYKTKCEQYLNSNGRNWHQLYKNYVNAVKAKKVAEKKNQNK